MGFAKLQRETNAKKKGSTERRLYSEAGYGWKTEVAGQGRGAGVGRGAERHPPGEGRQLSGVQEHQKGKPYPWRGRLLFPLQSRFTSFACPFHASLYTPRSPSVGTNIVRISGLYISLLLLGNNITGKALSLLNKFRHLFVGKINRNLSINFTKYFHVLYYKSVTLHKSRISICYRFYCFLARYLLVILAESTSWKNCQHRNIRWHHRQTA